MADPSRLATVSAVEALVAALRSRILGGNLTPNTPLPEVALAEEYGVSRPTVKSAITLLTEQGMLRRDANKSAYVPRLTRSDVIDLFFVRIPLELEVVRFVINHQIPEGACAAVQALHGLAADEPPSPKFAEIDLRFHRELVDSVASRRLGKVYEGIIGEIHLLMLQSEREMGRDQIIDDHGGVLEAMQNHEEGLAVSRMRDHLERARDAILKRLPR